MATYCWKWNCTQSPCECTSWNNASGTLTPHATNDEELQPSFNKNTAQYGSNMCQTRYDANACQSRYSANTHHNVYNANVCYNRYNRYSVNMCQNRYDASMYNANLNTPTGTQPKPGMQSEQPVIGYRPVNRGSIPVKNSWPTHPEHGRFRAPFSLFLTPPYNDLGDDFMNFEM